MPRRRKTPKRSHKVPDRLSRFIATTEDMFFVTVKSVIVEESPAATPGEGDANQPATASGPLSSGGTIPKPHGPEPSRKRR